ncbi:MAG: response regulator [Planctomycetota bacterium]
MSHNDRRILMVDDEPNILDGFRRSLGRKYELLTAIGGAAALAVMAEKGPFAVVVTDMQMPGMNGVQFLEAARERNKDTSFMMLTGNADQGTAVQAINRGHIFRFLNKPCAPELLEEALEAAIRQYQLVTAERVLLRDTLGSSIRVLTEALALSDPALGELVISVRHNVSALCEGLGVPADWRFSMAASLSLLGFVVVETGDDHTALSDEKLLECAECGARLLRLIPRMEQVVAIIKRQREAGELPQDLCLDQPAAAITIGARLLRIAVDVERACRNLMPASALLDQVRHGPHGAPLSAICGSLLSKAPKTTGGDGQVIRRELLNISSLHEGMQLEEDIRTTDQKLILAKGNHCTTALIERLRAFAKAERIPSEVTVSWSEKTNPA